MTNLGGCYEIANKNLTKIDAPTFHLVIGTRNKPTPKKPKTYLLRRFPDGKHKYLSSLFPIQNKAENSPQAYSLDYEGHGYNLIFNNINGQAIINSCKEVISELYSETL
jgi:hypothetical protein